MQARTLGGEELGCHACDPVGSGDFRCGPAALAIVRRLEDGFETQTSSLLPFILLAYGPVRIRLSFLTELRASSFRLHSET